MYGRDEHRYTLRRITDAVADLDAASAKLDHLMRDLLDDDAAATTKGRGYLGTAQLRITSALGQCDLAVQHLPTPAARVTT